MSAFESTYPSLIQGVSQQQPEFRQPGQLSSQVNMLSDPVHGLRRRPGTEHRAWTTHPGTTSDMFMAGALELGGRALHYILNTATGALSMYDAAHTLLPGFPISIAPYVLNNTLGDICTTVVGNELFLLNKTKQPTVVRDSAYPYTQYGGGYVFIRSGVYSTKYELTLTYSNGVKVTASYLTPNGATPGDATLTTPEYIANSLLSALDAALIAEPTIASARRLVATTPTNQLGFVTGATFALRMLGTASLPTASCKLSSSTSTVYMDVSNGYVSDAARLPPIFPTTWGGSAAEELIVATGSLTQPTYYRFSDSRRAWVECAGPETVGGTAYVNSVLNIVNCPISIKVEPTSGTVSVVTDAYEGRISGDTVSNPEPVWCNQPITGIGTYQGRLVLLSGATVTLSGSTKPRRFMRTTVTSLVDSDPISISSSNVSAGNFTHCVPFQKDLLVFGAGVFAAIPSNSQALTPRTASVVVLGETTYDGKAPPVPILNSVLVPRTNNAAYSGFSEVKPTGTVSLYSVEDATPHLPAYFAGSMRWAVAAQPSGLVIFGSSADRRDVYVHQFVWSGSDKVQQAWHTWSFPLDIAHAYYAKGYVYFIAHSPQIGLGALDNAGIRVWRMRLSTTPHTSSNAYLDGTTYASAATTDPIVPACPLAIDRTLGLKVVRQALPYLNSEAGVSDGVGGVLLDVNDPARTSAMAYGYPYTSSFIPSEPVLRKQDGTAYVSADKLTIVKYTGTLTNSGPFQATVQLSYAPAETYTLPTVRNSTASFALPVAAVAPRASVDVGVRAVASEHTIQFSTSGTYEMNFKALSFTERHHQKLRRI